MLAGPAFVKIFLVSADLLYPGRPFLSGLCAGSDSVVRRFGGQHRMVSLTMIWPVMVLVWMTRRMKVCPVGV